jgi:putative DNA primase/helicase
MGKIKAVRKYENPIEFPETHKLWIDTNKKPTIRDGDDRATFNRLHPIPFTVCIPKDRIDRDLPQKLSTEAEGILAWLVVGANNWFQSGLTQPPEVRAASDQWRSESDQLGRFIKECCVTDEAFGVSASRLYARYKSWAEANTETPMTATAFGGKVAGRGFERKHTKTGERYAGIDLRIDPRMDER